MEDLLNKIRTILDTPDEEVDIDAAALLLLKFNRNRIMRENIIRHRNVEKLKYELKKVCDYYLLQDAQKESQALEQAAATIAMTTLAGAEEKPEDAPQRGQRPDHDALPEDIQAIYSENLQIYRRMRKYHEQLKLMAKSKPCDRYPFLKELKEQDDLLRANWERYDNYVAEHPKEEDETNQKSKQDDADDASVDVVKKISAARKYLSDNKIKISVLEGDARAILLAKMQQRVDFLIKSEAGISTEQIEELRGLGLTVDEK
jgi:hypothetical protein